MQPTPIIFLDRDGTLIHDRHYLADPAGVELLPNAVEGLGRMQALGGRLVVVTNQSGIGRGYFTVAEMEAVHARIVADLARAGIALEGFYHCPHTPDAGCDCRKPRAGMIHQALAALDLDAASAANPLYVIGDKPCDIELGHGVGARSILVRTGYGAAHEAAEDCTPDVIVDDLLEAAAWIATDPRAPR